MGLTNRKGITADPGHLPWYPASVGQRLARSSRTAVRVRVKSEDQRVELEL